MRSQSTSVTGGARAPVKLRLWLFSFQNHLSQRSLFLQLRAMRHQLQTTEHVTRQKHYFPITAPVKHRLCRGYVKGSSFQHPPVLLEGQTEPTAQDPLPLAKEACMETRAPLPRRSGAYPLWVLFCLDEGSVPQGLFSPPLITTVYPSHAVHTPMNCCLQKLSSFTEKAQSNHCAGSGNHIEQTASIGAAA